MSIALMALIFEIKDQLTPTEKLILLELSDHGNDQGDGIWPSLETIAERTSLSESTIRTNLTFLTRAGLIETIEEPTAKTSTKRKLNVRMLETLRDCGEKGEKHALLYNLRSETRVPVADTLKLSRVPVADTQSIGGRHSEYRSPALRVPVAGTESLIKHNLNIKETKEESAVQLSPSQLWNMITDQLRGDMSSADYLTWVHPLQVKALNQGTLTIRAANSFGAGWCRDRLGTKVTRLATALVGQDTSVVFQVE